MVSPTCTFPRQEINALKAFCDTVGVNTINTYAFVGAVNDPPDKEELPPKLSD
jgi:hypothetical protein